MSATIGINKLKFTIFASGHDYTLADSGDGNTQVFSHPYVPLNSDHYAGMWFFLVPDENGDPMDCVKDDIAHCEFTPAIGATFDTEGDVTVECHYHREYVYPEETLVVDKTVRQKITVVNHGTVSNSAHWNSSWNEYARVDIYTDGYAFFRPMTTTEVGFNVYSTDVNNVIVKTSSIPWRARSIGRHTSAMLRGHSVVDISEFASADVSNATIICLLSDTYVEDISALAEWDTSACTDMQYLLYYNTKITDLSPLLNWNTGNVTTLFGAIAGCTGLTNLHGLENWDVSKVTNLCLLLSACANLTDISALMNWDVSSVTNIGSFLDMHNSNPKLTSLHGLENWDVSSVTDMIYFVRECSKISSLAELSNWRPKPTSLYSAFYGLSIKSLNGLENFDVSNCTSFGNAFYGNYFLTNCDGVSGWNVSRGTDFSYMIAGAYWLTSLKAFENWNFGGNCGAMFYIASVMNVNDVVFDLSRVTNPTQMFYAIEKDYSSKLGKDLIKLSNVWYDVNHTMYTVGEVDDGDHPLSEYIRDASNASNWTVNGSNLQAFNSDRWSNIPAWN